MDGQNWPSYAVKGSSQAHRASTSGENTEPFVFPSKNSRFLSIMTCLLASKMMRCDTKFAFTSFLVVIFILYRNWVCSEMLCFPHSGAQGWLFVVPHSLSSSKFCDVCGVSLFMHSSTDLVIVFSTIFINHHFPQ